MIFIAFYCRDGHAATPTPPSASAADGLNLLLTAFRANTRRLYIPSGHDTAAWLFVKSSFFFHHGLKPQAEAY